MPLRLAAVIALAVVATVPGCSRKEFVDHTAKITVDGRTTTFTVDSCGLDRRTVFVVAHAPGGGVLQAVVGVRQDHKTGVTDRTGLTVTSSSGWTTTAPNEGVIRSVTLAAFGPGAWQLRKGTGRAPGQITSARVRGSRIQVAGSLVQLDDQDQVVTPVTGEPRRYPFTLDARCDAKDQG